MLRDGKMPPKDAPQPSDGDRQAAATAIEESLSAYSAEHAGDPGPVVLRRLTSAEYGYTIADLHTYYVLAGDVPVLVHNNGGLPSAPGFITLDVVGDSCPVSQRGDYYDMSTDGATADVDASVREYARRSNRWLEANGPQTVTSTRALQAQIRREIRAERTRNPHLYPPGIVPGHVPDTGVTGMPNPPGGWLPQPIRANSIAGGGLSSRIGKVLRGYLVNGEYLN